MKRLTAILIFISLPILLFGQDEKAKNVYSLAISQTYRMRINYIDNAHKQHTRYAFGIVLKGQYYATCYHIVQFKKQDSILNAFVLYNDTPFSKYDSVSVDLKNKISPVKYDTSDYATDYVMLKLNKPIPPVSYKIIGRKIGYNDTTLSLGNKLVTEQGQLVFARYFDVSFFISKYLQSANSKTFHILAIGEANHGYSGSPLYNTDGEIIGIIQAGFDKVPIKMLNSFHDNGMSDEVYNRILSDYKNGKRLFIAINIGYIKDNYLKDYW